MTHGPTHMSCSMERIITCTGMEHISEVRVQYQWYHGVHEGQVLVLQLLDVAKDGSLRVVTTHTHTHRVSGRVGVVWCRGWEVHKIHTGDTDIVGGGGEEKYIFFLRELDKGMSVYHRVFKIISLDFMLILKNCISNWMTLFFSSSNLLMLKEYIYIFLKDVPMGIARV